jgi:murein DD-endopeptidase MepM/ murein hydrolase activator NlpD
MVALLLGDYLRMKLQRSEVKEMVVEARVQQERLSSLYHQTREIQTLMAHWKDLRGRIQASLPSRQKVSANSHEAVDGLENYLNSLQGQLKQMIASIPTELPASGKVSSGVGMRPSPWTGEAEFHSGLDIPNPMGTAIHAPANGVVDYVGPSNGNGQTVLLDHGQGVITQYAHLSRAHVRKGDLVYKGQRIADVGNTGKSTNPHLHYEVRVNGVPIDPRRHLIK